MAEIDQRKLASEDIAPKFVTPKMNDALRDTLAQAGLSVPPEAFRAASKKIADAVEKDIADLTARAPQLNAVLDTFGKTGAPESDMTAEEPLEEQPNAPAQRKPSPERPAAPARAGTAAPAIPVEASVSAEPQLFGAPQTGRMAETETPLIATDESGMFAAEPSPADTARATEESAGAEAVPQPPTAGAPAQPAQSAQIRGIERRIDGFAKMRERVLRERKKLERAALPLELRKRALTGTRFLVRLSSWLLYAMGAILALVGIGEFLLTGAVWLTRTALVMKREIKLLTARLKPITDEITRLNDRLKELNKDIQSAARQLMLLRTPSTGRTSAPNRPVNQQAFSS